MTGPLPHPARCEGVATDLEPAREELVLDLEEVALGLVVFERLVDDGEADVVLNVLPAPVPVTAIQTTTDKRFS